MSLRIISGEFGGRIIATSSSYKTHPMGDRIRGALFNMLGDISDLRVLDAFAGNGSLGLEALSRGAKEAVFVERDHMAQKILQENIPSAIVNDTVNRLSAQYKVQANPRAINLFYMKDNIRNRIVQKDEKYFVDDTDIAFTADELRKELHTHPGRFSPNVILRGIYQEKILPNIAFIGGG